MKKQKLPLQQLSFTFEDACKPETTSEAINGYKKVAEKFNSSANIIYFDKAVIARKVNIESIMYQRILDSVKHIA